MPFVNEFISLEDFEKYDIKKIDERFTVGGVHSDQWTIDRKRDIYLRQVTRGREEFYNQSKWTLFFNGVLILLELHLIAARGNRGEPGWVHWHLNRIYLPTHLENKRLEIITTLNDALIAHKDDCMYSSNTDFSVTLTD